MVQGKIGEFVADAAVVSTDRTFDVQRWWHNVVEPEGGYRAEAHRPDGWTNKGWGRDKKGRQVWFLDVTSRADDGAQNFERLKLVLTDIAESQVRGDVEGRELPLVAVPVIGTGWGGFSNARGTVVDQLLRTCLAFVAHNAIDVVIVAVSDASYAALQNRRRAEDRACFPGIDLGLASALGERARQGTLALFIGAGASIPAGAPSWKGLIEELAKEAGLSPEARSGFERLSALDQAELLRAKLPERMGTFIKERVEKLKPAIAHVLLANLDCDSAVTTNYDRLYESAAASMNDRAATVLPAELPPTGSRWLLKLHGDMEDPDSIVLTRSQFVGFTGVSGPAGAVVQALLLTKHLLVVGVSMTDDNVLRLIYEVGAYRDRSRRPREGSGTDESPRQFGTIISLDDDEARRELYKPYFAWEAMPGTGNAESGRQLEIFLDAVATYASDDHSWLLDPRFESLLPVGERPLAERVRELADEIDRASADGNAWSALAQQLGKFGVS